MLSRAGVVKAVVGTHNPGLVRVADALSVSLHVVQRGRASSDRITVSPPTSLWHAWHCLDCAVSDMLGRGSAEMKRGL